MQHPVHVRLAVRTALALQHITHVRLAVRASNPRLTQRTVKTGTSINQPRPTPATRNDRPAAFNDSTNLSFPQRSSSCILQLNWHQLPATIVHLHPTTRPTSATSNASLRLDHTSYRHHPSSWRHKYNCHGLCAHVCKYDNKLSPLLYFLRRLSFVHSLWLSITHTL